MNGRQILISTTAGSLFPSERTAIVSAWSSESVSSAFQKLISNRILSVPVYDVERRRYTHFMDMVDVVAYAVETFTAKQEPSHLTQFMDTPLLQTVNCGDISDKSKRNPYYPVETGAPLLEVLNLMVKWGVHRIPVVDSEGDLHTIISQSQLSTFIYKYLRSFSPSLLNQTASSIAASIPTIDDPETQTPAKVISVGLKDRAIDAFITMHDKRISGVAVVDENDAIVGNISASDLKAIGYDGTLVTRLFYPIAEFLRILHAPKDSQGNAAPPSPSLPNSIPPPTTIPSDASFGTALGALVNGKIHRVYVVDEEKKAVGVIGYAEILRAVQANLQANMRAHTYSESSTFAYF